MRVREYTIIASIFSLSCINFIYILWHFKFYSHLPPPFFVNANDTFMDFYNTLYWSGNDGIYEIWGSVYPPLNFLFLKAYQFLFINEVSEISDAFAVRDTEESAIIPLLLIYIVSLLISIRISFGNSFDFTQQFFIFIIFLLSPVFLFALERGNLLILCVPILCFYIFSKKQMVRALAFAFLVNLKPYFAIFYLVQMINKQSYEDNKDFLFLSPVFSLILYLSTGLLLNEKFYMMPFNLFGFATASRLISSVEALSFPSSITSFSYIRGLVTEFRIPPILGYLVKLLVYAYLIKIFFLIFKKKLNFEDLTIFSIIFLTNYSTSTGGYGLLFYLPVLALLYKQREWLILSTIVVTMYIGIWDLIPIYHYSVDDVNVYLSGNIVKINPYLSFGSIIRPIANFIVLVLFFKNLEKR
jgi:hypothetical protein